MRRALILAGVAMLPSAALAQAMPDMPGMPGMPGMKMSAKAKPKPAPRKASPRRASPSAPKPTSRAAPAKVVPPAPAADPARARPPEAPAPATPVAPSAQPQTNVMPGMDMSAAAPAATGAMAGMDMADPAKPADGSGTSRQPAPGGAMHGLHVAAGDWMIMLHGYLWGAYTDQSGPRGDTSGFVMSMAMAEARRNLGQSGATLTLKSMLSLDPLMGKRGYPSLLATGETADGVTPLIDRQHPHDLFMELSTRVDVPIGGGVTGFVYGGPVAEPALGPSAFMHRSSAKYLPLAPITHHWFDSTHISFGVVTAGVNTNRWQIEGSAFRGREPDQYRWNIETPKLDSWSVRATWNPSANWSAQVSHGRIKSPEALEPGLDEARTTASVQYARGGFSALAAFSAKNRVPGRTLTAWIGEANWDLTAHHSLFGRIENAANDELFPSAADPRHDRPYRVTRGELGYAYRVKLLGPVEATIGGSGFVVRTPHALDSAYGKTPVGWTGFIKLSLGG